MSHIRTSVLESASGRRKQAAPKPIRLRWGHMQKKAPTTVSTVGAGEIFTREYERAHCPALTAARVSLADSTCSARISLTLCGVQSRVAAVKADFDKALEVIRRQVRKPSLQYRTLRQG